MRLKLSKRYNKLLTRNIVDDDWLKDQFLIRINVLYPTEHISGSYEQKQKKKKKRVGQYIFIHALSRLIYISETCEIRKIYRCGIGLERKKL